MAKGQQGNESPISISIQGQSWQAARVRDQGRLQQTVGGLPGLGR